MKKTNEKFLNLLKKILKDAAGEDWFYTDKVDDDLWCPEFQRFVDAKSQGNVSKAEKTLLTRYRKEFIAWYKIQQ